MEDFKKILVPFDDSKLSQLALDKALSLAKMVKGEVTLIHVIETYVFPINDIMVDDYSSIFKIIETENEKRVRTMLENYASKGENEGVKFNILISKGNVANEIIEVSSQYDIIIIGTMGHNLVKELLLGSTAEKVARHACCPVMLVREIKNECKDSN